jgi:hypothetical protein
VPATGAHINFGAPAVLRKWPSLNKERISSASPYSVAEGTLDECIRRFSTKPISQQHLYEIRTASQGELVTARGDFIDLAAPRWRWGGCMFVLGHAARHEASDLDGITFNHRRF